MGRIKLLFYLIKIRGSFRLILHNFNLGFSPGPFPAGTAGQQKAAGHHGSQNHGKELYFFPFHGYISFLFSISIY